jgi:hypothetical protein
VRGEYFSVGCTSIEASLSNLLPGLSVGADHLSSVSLLRSVAALLVWRERYQERSGEQEKSQQSFIVVSSRLLRLESFKLRLRNLVNLEVVPR